MRMNLIIPPPIVGLLTAGLMWVFHYGFQDWDINTVSLNYLGYLFALLGILIEVWSVARFFKVKTTINPLKPERSNHLVTNGLFQYSRNPMYVGMLSVLLGFGLWLGNPVSLLALFGFVAYLTEFQIKPEESILLENFGEEYRQYQTQVRRWV